KYLLVTARNISSLPDLWFARFQFLALLQEGDETGRTRRLRAMLKYSKSLRDKLAVIGVAGAFAFTPLVISPVMAQVLGNESDEIRIIEEDTDTLQGETGA